MSEETIIRTAVVTGGSQMCIRDSLKELCRMSGRQLADQRYKKYRQIGETRLRGCAVRRPTVPGRCV